MKPLLKVTLVGAGYVVALLVATAVVAIHVAATSGPAAQASSGMLAFADAFLFVGVFSVAAVVPTGMALFFLRSSLRLWSALSASGLAMAVTGVVAAILFAIGRHAPPSPLATWADLSMLRILVAPFVALTFLVCTILSPTRSSRFAFLCAALLEAAVSAYGGLVWLVPLLLGRL